MMKMYKKPETEVMSLNGSNLMQGIVVSPGAPADPSSPPGAQAPGRRGDVID